MSTNKQPPLNLEQLLNMDMGELSDWLVENAHRFTLQPKPIKVDSPEEIGIVGEEILVWDGCDWSIDYVDCCPETGAYYMANNTDVEAYLPLPEKL
ncbi:hypothetical protein [Vibrio parahaemolyticus]|uniref:hypothetical protein n=1 Tax=Vibrio parahaemolyticus TaxID=670 RepID=UPI001121B108|nr:hypothetical protein [Vibrio parahaemolyticus]TOJ96080.1 hypothetical protein CGI27_20805 [Vibrio parahaemolyticus]